MSTPVEDAIRYVRLPTVDPDSKRVIRSLLAQIDAMHAEIDAERALRMLAMRQRDEAEDEAAGLAKAEGT